MSTLSVVPDEPDPVEEARRLIQAGVPVFVAPPVTNDKDGREFRFPPGWESTEPDVSVLDRWQPGWALCAVTGVLFDVLDHDPRHDDGDSPIDWLDGNGLMPKVFGVVRTGGGGKHYYVARTGLRSKDGVLAGLDHKAGDDGGGGRGMVYLPGTLRAKHRGGGYGWEEPLDVEAVVEGSVDDEAFVDWGRRKREATAEFPEAPPWTGGPHTRRQAAYLEKALKGCCEVIREAPEGTRNTTLFFQVLKVASYVKGAGLSERRAKREVMEAGLACGLSEAEVKRTAVQAWKVAKPRGLPAKLLGDVDDAPDSEEGEHHVRRVALLLGVPEEEVGPFLDVLDAAGSSDVHEDALKKIIGARGKEVAEQVMALLSPAPPFDFGLASQMPDEAQVWRVEGLLPQGGRLSVVAQRKTGKTTFSLNLARSLLTGVEFLGRFPVTPIEGVIGYLNFEVAGSQVTRWAREVGVPTDRLFLVNLRGRRNPFTNPVDLETLRELLIEHKVSTLFVDPFGRAFPGENPNDNGAVQRWLCDLDLFAAECGVGEVVLVVHAGWGGDRSRGASALEDWPDVMATLTRDKDDAGRRYFRAEGRDVDVPEDRLEFEPSSRGLTLAGEGSARASGSRAHLDRLAGVFLKYVREGSGLTLTQVKDLMRAGGCSIGNAEASQVSAELEGAGWIRVEVSGRARRHYYVDPSSVVRTMTADDG